MDQKKEINTTDYERWLKNALLKQSVEAAREAERNHEIQKRRQELRKKRAKTKKKIATFVIGASILALGGAAGYKIADLENERQQRIEQEYEETLEQLAYDNALNSYRPIAEEIINENMKKQDAYPNPVYMWDAKGAAEKLSAYQSDLLNQGYEDVSRNIIATIYTELQSKYPAVSAYDCTDRMVKEFTGGLGLEEYFESLGYTGEDIEKVIDEIRHGLMANKAYEENITQEGGLKH